LWEARSKDSNGSQLAVSLPSSQSVCDTQCFFQKIAIKLFSVSPSEMCDERTASKMSAFSTAKRNGLSGENIIRMAQLQQYWRYGFTDPKYSHTATLTLPKTKSMAQSIQLPTPTLNDLLNPEPANSEEPIFLPSDPYGAQALDDEDGEDWEDEDSPTITRSSIKRLEIDNLVDLSTLKLLARFIESPASSKDNPISKIAPLPNSAPSKWSDNDSKWANSNDMTW
jgi:hypothetical protein